MFGKEFIHHLDILTQSFGEMNEKYQEKIEIKKKKNLLIENLQKLYIILFGIPEIGFQTRSIYFRNMLSSHLSDNTPKKILDAGSGIGAYTFWLAKIFPNAAVTGGEIDKSKLKSAKVIQKELHLENIDFIYFDLTKIDKSKKYDLIVIVDVLEHINNYQQSLKNLYVLLNKGGFVFIHVPQPNQKRIFSSLKNWHHDDHVYEGIKKKDVERELKKLGCRIVSSKETFGFFGKLAWEINHILLAKSFLLTGITFPFLYMLTLIDTASTNKNGLGIALLAQKK